MSDLPMLVPPTTHNCRLVLPDRPGGYGSTGVPDGTVALCRVCDRPWVSLPCYESYGPTEKWYPVRWYTRSSIRRRVAELRARQANAPHSTAPGEVGQQ